MDSMANRIAQGLLFTKTNTTRTACIITGGECALTTNENFAMIGQDGNPIECPVAILEEEVTP